MLQNSWTLAANFSFNRPTKNSLPVTSSFRYTAQILKLESSIRGVPASWRRAGYLRQVESVIPLVELAAVIVPLNTAKIFALPLLSPSYHLIFQPVPWLPAGLRVRIYRYVGEPPTREVLEQLLHIR